MIKNIVDALSGNIIDSVGNVVDKFVTTDAEKAHIRLETQKVILAHIEQAETSIRAEMDAKKAVIIAEMQSGDTYTKRARPTVVYGGLIAIFVNHVIGPWAAALAEIQVPEITLPTEFWWAWGGVVSVWFVGRSAERRGIQHELIKKITGN